MDQLPGPTSLPIDWASVEALVELGDLELLENLAQDFLADAEQLIESMERAVAAGDRKLFRSECHALRSSSANVGARSVTRLCQDRVGNSEHFAADGHAFCARLREEIAIYRRELSRFLDQRLPSSNRLI